MGEADGGHGGEEEGNQGTASRTDAPKQGAIASCLVRTDVALLGGNCLVG